MILGVLPNAWTLEEKRALDAWAKEVFHRRITYYRAMRELARECPKRTLEACRSRLRVRVKQLRAETPRA